MRNSDDASIWMTARPSQAVQMLRRPRGGRRWLLSALMATVICAEAAAEDGNASAQAKGGSGLPSLTALLPALTPVPDYTGSLEDRYALLGDNGGERQRLYERGFTMDGTFTQVVQGVASGGADKDVTYHGLFEYGVTLDTGKLGLWPGGLFVFNGYTSVGETPFGDAGNLAPVNFK